MADSVEEYLLVVDDEPENLDLIRRTCFGRWKVSAFADPVQAVGFAHTHRLAAVISDFRMPKMNGDEFLSKVCDEDPTVGCILVTAFGDLPEVRRLSEQDVVSRLLLKPWDVDEFLRAVEQAIELTKMRRSVANLTVSFPEPKDPRKT